MSRDRPMPIQTTLTPDTRVAIVAARFNASVVDILLEGCSQRLVELGIHENKIEVHRVPGAFELPLAAKLLGQGENFDAIICLGCVVRGDTPHFEYVSGQASGGIMQVGLELGLPVIFGVLTVNTQQQALDRAGGSHSHAGRDSADTAVAMISLAQDMHRER